jgi:DNA excision repair protein ERCC-2
LCVCHILIHTRRAPQTEAKLKEEYHRLVDGFAEAAPPSDELLQSPVCHKDRSTDPIHGSLRKPEHFLVFLQRSLAFLEDRLKMKRYTTDTLNDFCANMYNLVVMERQYLSVATDRLNSLLNALEIDDVYQFRDLKVVTDLLSMLGTYNEGFVMSFEPYDERIPTSQDPYLQLACLDSTLALKSVFKTFNTVVVTSGTLSPLHMYSKLLGFTPLISKSLPLTLTNRNVACPLVMTRGSDQVAVSTRYKTRNDPSVVRNYGTLLVEMSKYVPDGIVAFFTTYQYMDDVVTMWNEMGLLESMRKSKLVLIETPSVRETAIALNNYRRACDSGRGAIFLTVARSQIAESVHFGGQYGRAAIVIGLPFLSTESRIFKPLQEYLKKKLNVDQNEYMTFDALRYTSGCLGKLVQNKNDYACMVLADKRYNQSEKRALLPGWMQQQLSNDHLSLSTDKLLEAARKFLKEMAQNRDVSDLKTLSENDVRKIGKKLR